MSTSYVYDRASNVTSVSDGGGTVGYAYGPSNLLDSVTEPSGAKTTFGYDDNANRTGTTYPNGVTMTETYDSSDQKTSIVAKNAAGGVLTSFAYSYRDASSVDRDLRQTVVDKAGNKTIYGYDGLDRLKRAQTLSSAGATVSDYTYAYDLNSNRTSQAGSGGSASYAYNAANQLTSGGGTSFAYDANGQETSSSAGRSWAYNVRNQATSLTPPGGSALALSYLGEGQAELRGVGSDTLQNTATGVSRLTSGSSSYSYTRDNDGRLISLRGPGGSSYYLFDALGSVVGLTDSTGAVKNSYAYDPFGNLTSSTTPIAGNPFQFASGYTMGGVYHFGQRYYDPKLGRWTSPDPLDQAGDLRQGNRYLYTGDDPVNYVDPTGLFLGGVVKAVSRVARGVSRVTKGANECYSVTAAFTVAGAAGGSIAGGPLGGTEAGAAAGATAGVTYCAVRTLQRLQR